MIAIGIGANSRASEEDFAAAIAAARRDADGGDVVATLDTAAFSPLAKAAAEQNGITFEQIALSELRTRNADCPTQSERSLALFGVASLAEASALAAAGAGSKLVLPRRILGNVTVAAAQSVSGEASP